MTNKTYAQIAREALESFDDDMLAYYREQLAKCADAKTARERTEEEFDEDAAWCEQAVSAH